MKFFTQQISSGKWGIYTDDRLLATVGCKVTCDTIMANLVSGRRDVPRNDTNDLYRAPKLKKEVAASKAAAEANGRLPDEQLSKALNAKVSVKASLEVDAKASLEVGAKASLEVGAKELSPKRQEMQLSVNNCPSIAV